MALATSADVLRGYDAAYERRRRANAGGRLFRNSEANGLAALMTVGASVAGVSARSGREAVASVTALTRRILAREPHSTATDLAGLAWACAYGRLAIDRPPVEQIEFVLESGNASGTISGAYAAGWRALFLIDAIPLLNWRHRPVAARQLERWMAYATEKALVLADAGHEAIGASQSARIAYVLGQVANRCPSPPLSATASALASSALSDEAGAPTAVAAQTALCAYSVGEEDAGSRRLERLLENRLDPARMLLRTGELEQRYELSPWVPLALLRACHSET